MGKMPPNENIHTAGLKSGRVLKEMRGNVFYFMKYISTRIYIYTHTICMKTSRQMKVYMLQV